VYAAAASLCVTGCLSLLRISLLVTAVCPTLPPPLASIAFSSLASSSSSVVSPEVTRGKSSPDADAEAAAEVEIEVAGALAELDLLRLAMYTSLTVHSGPSLTAPLGRTSPLCT
jgi:hypothetical protein